MNIFDTDPLKCVIKEEERKKRQRLKEKKRIHIKGKGESNVTEKTGENVERKKKGYVNESGKKEEI